MDEKLYQRFKQLKSRGFKSEARDAIKQFVGSFQSLEEKKSFTDWFFANDFDGGKVRHELYESVLFPVLLDGYRQSDPVSIKRLAETDQNLYQASSLFEQLGNTTKRALLRDFVKLCPGDSSGRHALLEAEVEFFCYCEHEWPAGIVYGLIGATITDCEELLAAVNEFRELDTERKYAEYIEQFEARVLIYLERLKRAASLS